MVIVMKMTAFAFNVADGVKSNAGELGSGSIAKSQEKYAVKQLPNIVEFLGFAFFFCGILAGPSFEFTEYSDFTRGKFPRTSFFSALLPSLACLSTAIVMVAGFTWHSANLGTQSVMCCGAPTGSEACDAVSDCSPHELASWFVDLGVVGRTLYLWVSVIGCRFSYYFAWKMAEGSIVLSGFGAKEGENGEVSWDRLSNVKVLVVEKAESWQECMLGWNMRTSHWLRHYCYNRLTSLGHGKFVATMGTFMLSAFWHGFYAGYYVTFFFGGMIDHVAKELRRLLRPLVQSVATAKKIYDAKKEKNRQLARKLDTKSSVPMWYRLSGILLTSWMLNQLAVPFQLLNYGDVKAVYGSVLFAAPVVVVVSLVFVLVAGPTIAAAGKARLKKAN